MPPRSLLARKSNHWGVHWITRLGKWQGIVYDQRVRIGANAKQKSVGLFSNEQACADAVNLKNEEMQEVIAKDLHAMAQDSLHTHGLPLRPPKAVDAQLKTAYYGEKGKGAAGEAKEFGPARYVCVIKKSRPGGFGYVLCCQEFLDTGAPCTTAAADDGKHCEKHVNGRRPKCAGASMCPPKII